MTNKDDPIKAGENRESQLPTPKDEQHRDLDSEIVRDLDVDEHGDDVRGGACPTSKPV
jgi:hypothetical protein